MRPRRRYFTPTQWLALILLAGGARGAVGPRGGGDFWGRRAPPPGGGGVVPAGGVTRGLPIGESDTLIGPDGQLWSYLHASTASRGIHDQWGAEVPFPGCVTLWKSANRGKDFHLFDPHCLIACLGDPCLDGPDDIDVQQYPRVLRADSGIWVMVYEWRGQDYLRTSTDGLNWVRSRHVPDTGVWPLSAKSCLPYQRIGPHPNITQDAYDCLSGGPPGLFL